MKKLLVGVALGIVASNAAYADDRYAVLDLGLSKFTDACKGIPSSWNCLNTDAALRGSVGYFFSNRYAAELSYASIGTAISSGPSVGGNAQRLDSTSSAAQISVVGMFVFDKFVLTGKVGIVRSSTTMTATFPSGASTTYTASRMSPGYGIGTEFFFGMDDPLIVRLQYEDLGTFGNAITGTSRVRLLSVGLMKFF